MTAEHEYLASAYLDGELSDAERRAAEADPTVMAEVESLRALRSRLGDVEPPSEAARERAIAAAMDAFAERNPATPPSAAAVPTLGRRRDPMWWMGAAAAVLVIGVLGVVLASGLGGGDTDDVASDTADEPASEEARAVEDATAVTIETAGDGDADAIDERSTQAASELAEDDGMLAPADELAREFAVEERSVEGDSTMADAPAAGATEMATDAASEDTVDVGDPEEYLDGRPIVAAEELRQVAHYLLELVEARELPPTPNHSCPFPDVLARGVLDEPDAVEPPVEIYIAVNPESRRARAIDQETCRVLLDAELDD